MDSGELGDPGVEFLQRLVNRYAGFDWNRISGAQRDLFVHFLSGSVPTDSSSPSIERSISANRGWNRVDQLLENFDRVINSGVSDLPDASESEHAEEFFLSNPVVVPEAWFRELGNYRAGAEIDLPWAED
ncbi:hypothetical protein [Nocardia sp. NPDC003345]